MQKPIPCKLFILLSNFFYSVHYSDQVVDESFPTQIISLRKDNSFSRIHMRNVHNLRTSYNGCKVSWRSQKIFFNTGKRPFTLLYPKDHLHFSVHMNCSHILVITCVLVGSIWMPCDWTKNSRNCLEDTLKEHFSEFNLRLFSWHHWGTHCKIVLCSIQVLCLPMISLA